MGGGMIIIITITSSYYSNRKHLTKSQFSKVTTANLLSDSEVWSNHKNAGARSAADFTAAGRSWRRCPACACCPSLWVIALLCTLFRLWLTHYPRHPLLSHFSRTKIRVHTELLILSTTSQSIKEQRPRVSTYNARQVQEVTRRVSFILILPSIVHSDRQTNEKFITCKSVTWMFTESRFKRNNYNIITKTRYAYWFVTVNIIITR